MKNKLVGADARRRTCALKGYQSRPMRFTLFSTSYVPDNLDSLFGQSRELEAEIKKQLTGLKYE